MKDESQRPRRSSPSNAIGESSEDTRKGSDVSEECKVYYSTNLNMQLTEAQYDFYRMLMKAWFAPRPRQPWVRKTRRKTRRF
jgi:hypothetical protein